jgi:UDP-N-acetylmuramoylalanine--D-glutamate ligase
VPQPIRIPDVAGKVVALLGLGPDGQRDGCRLAGERRNGMGVGRCREGTRRAARRHDRGPRQRQLVAARDAGDEPRHPAHAPAPHPVAALAKAAGKPLLGDIELLYRAMPKQRYVGITGTNGKSTTTTLIAHILRQGGKQVEVGGNLGAAALSLEPLPGDGIYVLELRSYQLELTPSPICDVAILLNITPDHLIRHGGMDGYIDAKALILRRKVRQHRCPWRR